MHGVPIDPPSSARPTMDAEPEGDHRSEIVFYVNGERHSATGDALHLTLAHWLRKHRGLVGTKIMCNEGDCGACSVLVGRINPSDSMALCYQAIDACITFLFQMDRCHVVTVEGIGGVQRSSLQCNEGQLTEIQKSMVECHGSQCGFCTPGFIMTMHGMIEAGQILNNESMRYGLSGNLCRCTGYVQILEAGCQASAKMNESESLTARLADQYDEPEMIKDFQSLATVPVHCAGRFRTLIPLTIEQACQCRSEYPMAVCVAGATDYGVLRNREKLAASDVIYLGQVDSHSRLLNTGSNDRECGFQDILLSPDRLTIGAGATWSEIERATANALPEYHQILTRFGSPQVRNRGTIGGNLASGSPIADSVPFHWVLDTEIELASIHGRRRVRLEDFYIGYRKTVLKPDEIIVAIRTRMPSANQRLRLFKISKRRDMDISTVTFAFLATIENDRIVDARVALGGVGPQVMRVKPVEGFLRSKPWALETLTDAGRMLRQNVAPWTDVRGGADYRCQLVEKLMVRSFYPSDVSDNVEQ